MLEILFCYSPCYNLSKISESWTSVETLGNSMNLFFTMCKIEDSGSYRWGRLTLICCRILEQVAKQVVSILRRVQQLQG